MRAGLIRFAVRDAGQGSRTATERNTNAPILFVPPQLRPLLARYARVFAPGLHVLSYNEIPDERQIEIAGTLE